MKYPAALALVAISCAVGAASPQGLLSSHGPLPLKSGETIKLFHQCSRSAPVHEGLIWQPSKAEVARLEAALPAYLKAVHESGQATPPVPPHYRGQYASYTERGKPRIYASFVPEDAAARIGGTVGNALQVCDGGSQFWGVVYDPASHSFSNLELNGPR